MKPEQLEFIEFLCLPSGERLKRYSFHTQEDFATHIGVTPKTLSTWKSQPKFQKEKTKLMRKLAGDSVSDVLNSLKNNALDGDTGAAKTYLEYLGEMVKKSEIAISTDDVQLLVSEIITIIQRHVKDDKVLNAIAGDIEALELD